MSNLNLQDLTLKVNDLCREVGAFIRQEREKFTKDKVELKSKNSLVSYVDMTSEQKIIEQLEKLVPEAGFIAEEGTKSERGKEYNWVIDPLDGTTNFVHGIPVYALSIALIKGNEPIIGVVYEINMDECFSAYGDQPSELNGTPIHVSENTSLEISLIATGFPYYDYERVQDYIKMLRYYMNFTRGVRRLGAAAVDLAYVAAGRFDCFFEYGLSPWDVAAGAKIVINAGGKVADFKGGDDFIFGREMLATNTHLHDQFLELTKQHFDQDRY